MSTLEIWLLAFGLAMDCFSVSVANGLGSKRFVLGMVCAMAFLFGFFQAAMPVIGWFCASRFSAYIERYDHWIAFALLAYLGINMIVEELREGEEHAACPTSIRRLLILSVATSIDALAVGISFACLGYGSFSGIVVPICVIGLVSFVMTIVGSALGVFVGRRLRLRAGLLGGVILLVIGLKILFEHLHIL